MSIELTAEQQQALTAERELPPRVVNPGTQETFVLVRQDVYERLQALLDQGDYRLSDTYAAQLEAALRAGWGIP